VLKSMAYKGANAQDTIVGEYPPGLTLYCRACANATRHLDIKETMLLVAVGRHTVYRWMKRGSVHWTTLPCGLRVICEKSLENQRKSRLLKRLLPFVAIGLRLPESRLWRE